MVNRLSQKGENMRLTVQGSMVVPFAVPNLEMHHVDGKGPYVIHYGGRGEESSSLLLPAV